MFWQKRKERRDAEDAEFFRIYVLCALCVSAFFALLLGPFRKRRMASEKRFGKVAVLMGGRSAEREISLLSGNAVLAALKRQGVDAHAFNPKERSLEELKHYGF